MSSRDLERALIRPLLRVAEQSPMTFVELMLRQAAKTPAGLELVGATMRDMTEMTDAHHPQSAGLESVLRLQQIVASGSRQ